MYVVLATALWAKRKCGMFILPVYFFLIKSSREVCRSNFLNIIEKFGMNIIQSKYIIIHAKRFDHKFLKISI